MDASHAELGLRGDPERHRGVYHGWRRGESVEAARCCGLQGANHAWVNRGKDLARVFAVVVPSLEIVRDDGTRLEKTQAGEIYEPKEDDD